MPGFLDRLTGLDPSGSINYPEIGTTGSDVWQGAREGWQKNLKGQGYWKSVGKAAASPFWGISPLPEGPADAWDEYLGSAKSTDWFGKRALTGALSKIPRGARSALQATGRAALRWAGPLILTGRLATETRGKGVMGGMNKATRIVGEEVAMTAGFVAGMPIGAAIGGAIGGALGSVAPGVGNAIGFVAGAAIGTAIGYAGGWAWNRAVDVAEMPYRIARGGYNFMRDLGKRSTKLELGGGVSAANRTRAAHTMRQRHLMSMNRSGMNARSLLGREAGMMHIRSLT